MNDKNQSTVIIHLEVGPEAMKKLDEIKDSFDNLRAAFEVLPNDARDLLLHRPSILARELDALLTTGADD